MIRRAFLKLWGVAALVGPLAWSSVEALCMGFGVEPVRPVTTLRPRGKQWIVTKNPFGEIGDMCGGMYDDRDWNDLDWGLQLVDADDPRIGR